MVVRITVNVLRASALLALILGVLNWVGLFPDSLIAIHMILGIIVVLSLWVLGGAIATTPGGIGLAIGAFVLGLITFILGLTQKQLLPDPNSAHWVIQVVHLLLGLSAIGMGEAIAGRYRRQSQIAKMQVR
ncbi:MAG: hypothetical protein JO215_14320 [Ktedonobacteraceae bacterium]|nr:hypothetical protein [Ktedonobacteraceae bacterium]